MSSSWQSSPSSTGPPPTAAQNSAEGAQPPAPPPKTFRTSASPYMRSSPTLSASSSTGSSSGGHSWSKPSMQPYINGRGNSQPVAAPRAFLPPQSPPLPSSSAASQGQQAYVRAPNPPLASMASNGDSANTSPTISFPSAFGTRQRVALKSSRPQFGRGAGRVGAASTSRQSATPQEHPAAPLPEPAPAAIRSSPNLEAPRPQSGRTSPGFNQFSWNPPPAQSSERSRGTTNLAPGPPPDASPTPSTSALGAVLGSGDWSDDYHTAFSPPRMDGSRSPSPLPSASPQTTSVLDRPRPKTPDPFAGSGSFSSRPSHGDHYQRSSVPHIAREPSPAPSIASASTSIIDRPRPKTPDPYASYSSAPTTAAQSLSNSPVALLKTRSSGAEPAAIRPGFRRADSTPPAATDPPPFGYSHDRQRNGSVIDRPRPKTPDAGAVFAFGGRGGWGDLPSGRPKTPETGAVFAFGVGGGHGLEERAKEAAARERQGSVLDRPRPRTPDPQSMLDQPHQPAPNQLKSGRGSNAGRFSFSNVPLDTDVKQSRIPLSSPSLTAEPPSFPTTHHTHTTPSSPLPAPPPPFNPNRASIDSTRTRTDSSNSGGVFRRSSESNRSNNPSPVKGGVAQHASGRSRFASLGAAPLLKLDLDLGGSDTMFDIAGMLKAGGGGHGSATSPIKREFGQVDRAESKALPPPVAPPLAQRPVVGIPAGRKEPLKVDHQPELNGEIDRTIPVNRPIVEEDEPPESPPMPKQSFEQEHPGPAPAKRRKSLASLLSLNSATHHDSSSASARPSTEASRPSVESSARSHSPDPNLSSMSTSTSAASNLSQSQSSYTSHGTHSSVTTATTSRTKRPSVASLDKSLPPTPASHTPTTPTQHSRARQASLALAAASAAVPLPVNGSHSNTDSPTKGALGRQLSKLRNRNNSHSGASSQSATSSSGFQFISGTSTRKGSSFSFGSGRGFANAAPAGGEKDKEKEAGSSTVALGRRLVERFGGSSSGSGVSAAGGKVSSGPSLGASASTRTSESGDLTMRTDVTDSPTRDPPFPDPPRRASLDMLSRTRPLATYDAVSSARAAGVLGMSLPAGRKSEDLLASRPRYEEQEQQETGQRRPPLVGRASFDLLTQRSTVPRRPSTDDLLHLATARLAALDTADNSPTPPPHSEAASTPPSNLSTTSLDLEHEHEHEQEHEQDDLQPAAAEPSPIVATATRIVRSGSTTSIETPGDSPVLSRTATPKLVRSDSLRRSDSRNTMLSAGTARERGSESYGTPSEEGTPRASHSPVQGRKRGKIPDSGVGSDSSMSSAWLDLEDSLGHYVAAVRDNRLDRGSIVANTLLPFLRREEDSPAPRANMELARRQRQVLFGWLSTLTTELREMQPTHRGACLEAVAAISESHFLSAHVLQDDEDGQARYRTAIVKVLAFAVEKLNDKAVYANTLVFSGRIFALAFFRIEGVAFKLLRALPPVKRQCLKRVLDEIGINEHQLPSVDLELFPSHLWGLCLRDLRSYTALLLPAGPRTQTEEDSYLVRDGELSVDMSGNWLIRWTASDSDLPFAFYRAYHRQLAAHLIPFEDRDDIADQPLLAPEAVITAPGCLFLAASLLEKSDALVHRNLRSVTSIGPNNSNFNTNDSANLSFGQKPKILELANRRLVQTMLDIVGGPPVAPGEQADAAPDSEVRRHTFSRLLRVWIRACVKKTSMWDTRSVFILLDLIEGLIYTLSYPAPSSARGSDEEVPVPKPHESCIDMFDIPFIFSFVKIILATADNTVTIMRTVAFIYAHFEIFTLRPADRDELCENIILDEVLFPRLYLHWNAGVRGYFIRLLVWRLSRLGIVDAEQHPDRPRDPRILALFGLMNVRLEAIRQRHDELEPLDNLTDDDIFKPKRSTICSTRGVKEAPFTVDELVGIVHEDSEEEEPYEYEEPQELVRSAPNGAATTGKKSGGGGLKDVATVARVVSWLKGGLGKSGKNKSNNRSATIAPPRIDPFILGNLPESASAQLDDPSEAMDLSMSTNSNDSAWTSASLPTSSTDPSSPSLATAEDSEPTISVVDTTPDRRRPASPAFFSFEFESGLAPRAEAEATLTANANSSSTSVNSGDTVFPRSPLRRNNTLDPHSHGGVVSPRVSLRFSKRISILPPAALDLLKESGEAVPPIPKEYLEKGMESYDRKLHPYAIRGLRDYEDALDEWTDWVARLQEEEDDGKKVNRGFVDTVPRLAVSWPQSFEEGA